MRAGPPPHLEIAIVEIDGEKLALVSWALRPGKANLTRAEEEVLQGLCAGRSNAAIAAARGTSVRTVANQVASLFRKLGVRSRHELVARAAGA